MNDLLTAAICLLIGAGTAVSASCVWGVLLIPARVQDRLQAGSPRLLTWAMCLGLVFCGAAGLFLGGMFVGMLAAALEEILEVAPVLMRRFRLGDVSTGVRFVMLFGKAAGAILAALVFTL